MSLVFRSFFLKLWKFFWNNNNSSYGAASTRNKKYFTNFKTPTIFKFFLLFTWLNFFSLTLVAILFSLIQLVWPFSATRNFIRIFINSLLLFEVRCRIICRIKLGWQGNSLRIRDFLKSMKTSLLAHKTWTPSLIETNQLLRTPWSKFLSLQRLLGK